MRKLLDSPWQTLCIPFALTPIFLSYTLFLSLFFFKRTPKFGVDFFLLTKRDLFPATSFLDASNSAITRMVYLRFGDDDIELQPWFLIVPVVVALYGRWIYQKEMALEAAARGGALTAAARGAASPAQVEEPLNEIDTMLYRDGSGIDVFEITCCYCSSRTRAPWVGTGIIRCGVCQERLQMRRPPGNNSANQDSRSGTSTSTSARRPAWQKLFSLWPQAGGLYFAISLTSVIIGMGFGCVAPRLLPPANTLKGALLWALSSYISLNVMANFYWSARTQPGPPPQQNIVSVPGAAVEWCQPCDAKKPLGTHHCRRCNICVYRMVFISPPVMCVKRSRMF